MAETTTYPQLERPTMTPVPGYARPDPSRQPPPAPEPAVEDESV